MADPNFDVMEMLYQIPGVKEALEASKQNLQVKQGYLTDYQKRFYEVLQPAQRAANEAASKREAAVQNTKYDKSKYKALFRDPIKTGNLKETLREANTELEAATTPEAVSGIQQKYKPIVDTYNTDTMSDTDIQEVKKQQDEMVKTITGVNAGVDPTKIVPGTPSPRSNDQQIIDTIEDFRNTAANANTKEELDAIITRFKPHFDPRRLKELGVTVTPEMQKSFNDVGDMLGVINSNFSKGLPNEFSRTTQQPNMENRSPALQRNPADMTDAELEAAISGKPDPSQPSLDKDGLSNALIEMMKKKGIPTKAEREAQAEIGLDADPNAGTRSEGMYYEKGADGKYRPKTQDQNMSREELTQRLGAKSGVASTSQKAPGVSTMGGETYQKDESGNQLFGTQAGAATDAAAAGTTGATSTTGGNATGSTSTIQPGYVNKPDPYYTEAGTGTEAGQTLSDVNLIAAASMQYPGVYGQDVAKIREDLKLGNIKLPGVTTTGAEAAASTRDTLESGDINAQSRLANEAVTPLDYTGQSVINTPEQEKFYEWMQNEFLVDNPAYSAYDDASSIMKQALKEYETGQTDTIEKLKAAAETSPEAAELWNTISSRLGGLNEGDLSGYKDAFYRAAFDPVARQSEIMQRENAQVMGSRGLGASTAINDVNAAERRALLGQSSDLSFRAAAKTRELNEAAIQNAMQQGNFWVLDTGNQRIDALKAAGAAQGDLQDTQGRTAMGLAGLGTGKMAVGQELLGNIRDVGTAAEARQMAQINLDRGIAQDRLNTQKWLMGGPADAMSTVSGPIQAATAMKTSENQAEMAAAAAKEQTKSGLWGLAGNLISSFAKSKGV